MSEKRLQRVQIRGENIEDYFTGDMTIIEGLPDDAELVDTYDEPVTQSYNFIFESEEFPVVEEGAEIPVTDLAVVRRRVNETTRWVCDNCHETHDNGDVKL